MKWKAIYQLQEKRKQWAMVAFIMYLKLYYLQMFAYYSYILYLKVQNEDIEMFWILIIVLVEALWGQVKRGFTKRELK